MKLKYVVLSTMLAGSFALANAQEKKNYYTKKASDNIFVGIGVGGMSVLNGGLNTPTMNVNLQFGKYITPTWGVRGVVSGLWQSLDDQDHKFFDISQDQPYHKYCKKFGEINLDAMLNITTLFGGYNPDRVVDFYLFGGPTMNLSKTNAELDGTTGELGLLADPDDLKARFGATAGLGLGFNLNKRLALNVEGRVGVTPSIFGDGSDCRKAEATSRVNLGLTYTFGGKKFVAASNIDEDAINAEINRYRDELAKAQADLDDCRRQKAQVEVKEVEKIIDNGAPRAIFFRIGSAKIDDYGMVNIKLAAKALKENSDKKFKIAGYCDKATGSAPFNQKLSEKRAQAVYDALVAEGVNKDQLELVGFGGTENMWGKNYLNRVVIME